MDGNALAELVKGYVDPLTTAAMILIPSICILYCLVEGIKWYVKGEQYQQQNPITDKLKKAIIIAVVMFSITAILKIFGVS